MSTEAPTRCPRCGETRVMHGTFGVCVPCAAECGWDPRCEACMAEDRNDEVSRDDHIATCDTGKRQARATVNSAANPLAHLPVMLEDAKTYVLWRYSYRPDFYVSAESRERHIDNDARATVSEVEFAMPWNAGYARGISEGRRQATEGWERHLRWRTAEGSTMDLIEPNVAAYVGMSRRLERQYGYAPGELQQRLVGPWEPVEQPDPITPEVYGEFFPERDEAGAPLADEQPEGGR